MAEPTPAVPQATNPTPTPPPDTASASPATPASDSTQYTEMVSNKDQRVYRVPQNRVKAYTDYGFVPTQKNVVNEEQVGAHFSDWRNGGTQFLISTVGNAPFVRTAVGKLGTAEQAKWLAGELDSYKKEHPYLDMAAGALGTGAEALGAVAAAPVVGLGAIGSAIAGAGIAGTAAAGAASNVALGAIARFDDASLHHAFEPAGQEKLSWSLADESKHVLQDAVLGAALPAGAGLLGKGLARAGKWLGSAATKTLRASVLKEAGVVQAQKLGRSGELLDAVDEVMQNAPKNGPGYIKAQLKKFGVQMETIKTTVGKRTQLSPQDRQALITDIHNIAGPDDQIIHRLDSFIQHPEWTLDHIQKANDKIYESIGWTDYDVNRVVNDKYQAVADRIKQAGQKILQDHDASFGTTTASEWNASFKDYSKWALLGGAYKPSRAQGFADVARAVAQNAAGGAALGTLMSGGNLAVGAGGILTGAGYGILKNVKPVHYAEGMKVLDQAFTWAGKKLTKAAMSGLYGVPAQLHSRSTSDDDSRKLNATLSAVQADPQKAFTNLRTHYANAGVPDVHADDAAQRQFAMMTDIASLMPQRQGGADLPTRTTPDKMQQRKINELYKVAISPDRAITNPTKENLAFAQKHYPNVLMATQQAVLQQLQQNPDLPYAAKAHAARLLGRPVSNSTSPKFSQMIQQARQQMAQAEQQGAQGAQPGKQVSKSVQSGDSSNSGTRLDELQGGGG